MQPTLTFPARLSERWRGHQLRDFIGLVRPKAVLTNFLRAPWPEAFLFLGPTGVGKTTMALALAELLPAELRQIPSRSCDLETLDQAVRGCHHVPWNARFHMLLVDEAEQITRDAQARFLSLLDATAWPPATIFIFTANRTDTFEPRFLSRLKTLPFTTEEVSRALPAFLRRVARREHYHAIDIRKCIPENGNVRDALNRLEMEALAEGVVDAHPAVEWERYKSAHLWHCCVCAGSIKPGTTFLIAGEQACHTACKPKGGS
jgi:replication-associated recombination protein RarA